MPIILVWNVFALPRAPLLKRLIGDLNVASLLLEKGLRRRLEDSERADGLTRAFPVFRFTDEAVSAYVTRSQYGQALVATSPGWAERLAPILPAWNLPRTVGLRVREANLLPRLLAALAQATSAIAGSISRFATPRPEMFREGAVSAVDIFGMGAMAFRALGAGRAGLYVRFRELADALNEPAAATPPGGASRDAPPPDLPLDMRVDDFNRIVVGALILLPAVSLLAVQIGPDILAWLRNFVLTEFFDVEQAVYDLRAQLFTSLAHGLSTYVSAAVSFLMTARDYALAHLDHWVAFAGAYLDGLHGGLTAFVTQFGTFWNGVRTLIAALIGYGDQILAIDLTDVIQRALVAFQYVCDFMIHLAYDKDENPARYVAPAAFPVNVGQLVLGEGGGQQARQELARGAGRLRALLAGSRGLQALGSIGTALKDINFQGLLAGVDLLGSRLNHPVLALPDQPVLRYSDQTEPDLVALVIRPAHAGLNSMVANLSTTMNTEVQATAAGLATMLDTAADTFDRAAAGAARSSLGPIFRRIVNQADEIATGLFPLEAARVPNALEPLAERFGTAMLGAFSALQQVVGGYLGFVLAEWRAHLNANEDTPVEVNATSPRILLKRARLGRVHLPEMVIHLSGHTPSASTAGLVARRFAGEIRAAYARGDARLDALRAAATAAG
jgi:hypothetical protein